MPDWIVKYWAEWVFGVLAGVLIAAWRSLARKVQKEKEEQEAIKLGLQALLRAQMLNDFNHYSEKGWAPVYARDNFDNCFKRYETLGENNVMTDVYHKFMALPAHPPK